MSPFIGPILRTETRLNAAVLLIKALGGGWDENTTRTSMN
jgi:hypothetical protein